MIPGEVMTQAGESELNAGRETIEIEVANTGDRPIQVGSHYHFLETTAALTFDREAAYGKRLDIPAGTAVRFEPGETKTVTLVEIAGDQIIPGISSNLGVHATEPDADPVGEWLASCEALKLHAREDHLGLPGHKLPFTGIPVRLDQLIDNHHGALGRLKKHLAKHGPRTAAECFLPVFGREIEPEVFGMALTESVGHLNHLLVLGEAERELDDAGAWRFRLL